MREYCLTGSWTALAAGLLMSASSPVQAQENHQGPAPPSNVVGEDHPWDDGEEIVLRWTLSPDDGDSVSEYFILQTVAEVGDFEVVPDFKIINSTEAGTDHLVIEVKPETRLSEVRGFGDRVDIRGLVDTGNHVFDLSYHYQVIAVDSDGNRSAPATTSTTVKAVMQPYDLSRLSLMIITFVFCGAVVFWINRARKGKPIKVRKIAGLEAVDEAVGRATEMGRPILYIPGIQDINEIQTITSMTILSRVVKTAAQYDAKVEVPTSKSLVMTTARETVQAAFMEAGRPDAYNEDLIYYVTDEQFGYVAYLQGMMVREKPATCFYMGAFFAESLILAETGNSIGAIQIAGTAMPAQLPFFVAACDYTLIGEEFFAASAYLSGEPEQLGSLKGQDVGKVIVAALLIVGVAMATVAAMTDWAPLTSAVTFFKSVILT